MKSLLIVFLLLIGTKASAQSDLIAINYNGRIEYYWVMYKSSDGRHTKIANYHSAISFFVDTKYLNSITLTPQAPKQYRVVRTLR